MWTSAKMLGEGLIRHWIQSLGGTGMAIVGLVASIENWPVPPKVWVGLSALLFLWAILQAFNDLRLRADAAEEALRDKRDHRLIADTLLRKYQHGVHEILNRAPLNVPVAQQRWVAETETWTKDVLETMKSLRCSSHDINCVETITFPELGGTSGFQAIVRMFDLRLQRLAVVTTLYAQRLEAVDRQSLRSAG